MSRQEQSLTKWCQTQLLELGLISSESDMTIAPLFGDASFRRYFRASSATQTWIAVDAPPQQENSKQFCMVDRLLAQAGVLVPEILAFDELQGFMLLQDFGDRLFLDHLTDANSDHYYQQAFDELLRIQLIAQDKLTPVLPLYDQRRLLDEMALFEEWFLKAYLGLDISQQEQKLIEASIQFIAEEVMKQPVVCVHRDFHSRNLMLPAEVSLDKPERLAVIDFQDAVIGPLTYDPVSLLKDCYVEWPRAKVEAWLADYHRVLMDEKILESNVTFPELLNWFDLMGLQRHLKVLGIFCRLNLRDGKANYMKDLPLTFAYVEKALAQVPQLQALQNLFQYKIGQAFSSRQ